MSWLDDLTDNISDAFDRNMSSVGDTLMNDLFGAFGFGQTPFGDFSGKSTAAAKDLVDMWQNLDLEDYPVATKDPKYVNYTGYNPVQLDTPTDVTLGGYTPTLLGDPSQVEEDASIRDRQMQGLSALDNIIQGGGFTEQDRNVNNLILGDQAKQAGRLNKAVTENMQSRGMGGSGSEIASRMLANQTAADAGNRAGITLANAARERMDNAIRDRAGIAGDIRSDDFRTKSANADAINRFNQLNTSFQNDAAKYGADVSNQGAMFNAGRQDDAAKYNANVGNDAARFNAAVNNEQNKYNTALDNKSDEAFMNAVRYANSDKMDQMQGMSSAYNNYIRALRDEGTAEYLAKATGQQTETPYDNGNIFDDFLGGIFGSDQGGNNAGDWLGDIIGGAGDWLGDLFGTNTGSDYTTPPYNPDTGSDFDWLDFGLDLGSDWLGSDWDFDFGDWDIFGSDTGTGSDDWWDYDFGGDYSDDTWDWDFGSDDWLYNDFNWDLGTDPFWDDFNLGDLDYGYIDPYDYGTDLDMSDDWLFDFGDDWFTGLDDDENFWWSF